MLYARHTSPLRLLKFLWNLLSFLETKRISPPFLPRGLIKFVLEKKILSNIDQTARKSFLPWNHLLTNDIQGKRKGEKRWARTRESCDPFGESLVRARVGYEQGDKGTRKWLRTTVKGAKINPVNIRDKARGLSPKRPAREETQEKTSALSPVPRSIVPRLKAVEKEEKRRKEKWKREIEWRVTLAPLSAREKSEESWRDEQKEREDTEFDQIQDFVGRNWQDDGEREGEREQSRVDYGSWILL